MEALRDAKNDRLWFKTNTKLGKLYLDREEWNRLARILRQLHLSCQNVDGSDDLRKGSLFSQPRFLVSKNNIISTAVDFVPSLTASSPLLT